MSKKVKVWLEISKIKTLKGQPSQFLDLNSIEYLQNELEIRVRKKPKPAKNLKELEVLLIEGWHKILDAYLKLIESMPRIIEVCIASNGWSTKY